MFRQEDWLLSQVAPTSEALAAGDGCHQEEARALDDYLNGVSNAQEAAKQITTPVSLENDPPAELYRLWALLSSALTDLGDTGRQKIIDLLIAIRAMPSTSKIDWSQLPGFGNMWSDLNRLHLQGTVPAENECLTVDRILQLRKVSEARGMAEAEMYVRDLVVPADWGYETLNLVCSRRPGLEYMLNEVHAWLKVAGAKLKESMRSDETKSFSNPGLRGRKGENLAVSCTMAEHWATWKLALSKLSTDESLQSVESNELAAECFKLMQEAA